MSAPQHKLAKEHEGRPLVFKTVADLEAKIREYFDWCDGRTRTTYDKDGNEKSYVWGAPYGMAGLAYFLDVDRKTITNYSHRDKYFPALAQARARIEADLEQRIIESRTPQGGIFMAKNNFGYVDETKQTFNGNLTTTNELTPEAAAILAKASRSDGTTESK